MSEPPTEKEAQSGDDALEQSLAPGFLVAAPSLLDPNFRQTLVLMAEHDENGALGFVVNRPAPITVGEMLGSIDEHLAQVARASGRAEDRVFLGGPVQQNALWILYERPSGEDVEGALPIGEHLALGTSRALLERVVAKEGPAKVLFLLGYAGWSPRQLERETVEGSWVPLDLQEDLVFDVAVEKRWEEAVQRLGFSPGAFIVNPTGEA
ncbi:MAG: YqgE/AlgH family protein [Deltaproteobacteria bacterium]|nr:MAG: YqgE/AlgH family protein [Deltaproteobacteria bacterium]